MALTEEAVIDKIEVLEDGALNVRTATRIYRNGVLVAETYARELLPPGAILNGKPQKVADVAGAVWKPDVVAAHQAKVAQASHGRP